MNDTSFVKILDTSMVIENGKSQIILLQDSKKEPEEGWNDNPWIIFLVIPLAVSVLAATFTHFLGRKKNRSEIDKLKVETEKIRNSFQPIVIATLQSIQEKVIDKKIEALFKLAKFRNKFTSYNLEYDEYGELIEPTEEIQLNQQWLNYDLENAKRFNDFFNANSYFFPDNIYESLGKVHDLLQEQNIEYRAFIEAFPDGDREGYVVRERDRLKIKNIITEIDRCIFLIRKDCHLDSRIIHDFIEKNIN